MPGARCYPNCGRNRLAPASWPGRCAYAGIGMGKRDAVISACGLYRYRLTRTWDDRPPLVYVMLNPSTADALKDDATIRVCMGRAQRMGCGGIVVVNLFAYRATHPEELLLAADPVGPENDQHISAALTGNPHTVIAAWGVGGNYLRRAWKVAHTCRMLQVPLHCLGVTKDGNPKHPLRIGYAVQPQPWGDPAQKAA